MIPHHAPSVNTEAVANPRPEPEPENTTSRPWVAMVSAEAMERSASLSPTAFRVWLVLDLHARTKTYCHVGDETVARMVGMKPRTIRLVLAELESAGYIRRVYTSGLADPGKGTRAHRLGVVLRKRLCPSTPAADTPETFDAAVSALGERSGTHGKILPRLMARSCQDSWQDPATEVSLSESALREQQHPCTGTVAAPSGGTPEPDPTPQEPVTLDAMAEMIPGHPELAPTAIAGLCDAFGKKYRNGYRTVVMKLAERGITPAAFREGLRAGRDSRGGNDKHPGWEFYQAALAPVVVAPDTSPAPAPTPNVPPAAESEARRQGVWTGAWNRFQGLPAEEQEEIRAEAIRANPGEGLNAGHLIGAMLVREDRQARERAEAARTRRRPMSRFAPMPAVAMA